MAKRVVIVGGGFGGLEAAKALADAPVEVTIVDRTNYHLFQPLLYQVAMAGLSPAEIAAPIRAIFGGRDNVHTVLGEVSSVDLAARELRVEGEPVAYDWLVLAAGAKTAYFGHDDWEACAPGMKSLEDALEIRRRVLLAFERAEREKDEHERRKLLTFVVIGGGATGVELAGALAELSRYVLARDFRAIDPRETRVILVEGGPRVLAGFPEDLSQSAVDQLHELGVDVRTKVRVVGIDRGGVDVIEATSDDDLPGLGSGDEPARIAAATVVWAAGVRASSLGETLGVPLDRQGRVVVQGDCTLPGHPEVFCVGDMARFEEKGEPLPGVSPVAMQQARYAAAIIRAEARGETPNRERFRYFDKGSMATIGRSRAIAYARGIKMHGFLAWMAWLVVHIWYLIGFRSRLVVLVDWAWQYLKYGRGARLITTTGWRSSRASRASPLATTTTTTTTAPRDRPSNGGARAAPPNA